MSSYSFIATDYEFPLVNTVKETFITVRETIELELKPHELIPWESLNPNEKICIVDDESYLNRLVIRKGTDFIKNVRWYTDKPFIYSLELGVTESSKKQLLEYLKENINEGQKLELWLIWLDDRQTIKPTVCNYDDFTLDNLKQMYDWQSKDYVLYRCIIIERQNIDK